MKYATAAILLLGLLASCVQHHAPGASDLLERSASSKTLVVMLGTGTPNAEPDRSGPAVAIVVGDVPYLIDCGPGVVRQASAAYEAGIEGLKLSRLRHVFLTHLHSDHTLGYPDLIFTPWVLERADPLEAFGPPGLEAMTEHLLKAYDEDVQVRLGGEEPANPDGYKVNVHEIEPGVVFRDENVTVTAFAVKHGAWKHAYGYRFDTPDRTIVVSGDTIPTDSLVEHARECDVLVHEVYSAAGFAKRTPFWQRYHAAAHTSTHELAEIVREIRPRILVLYHQLLWGSTESELLDEIRQGYNGDVRYGRDLEAY